MLPIRLAQAATLLFAFAHTAGMLNTAYRDDHERAAIEGLQAYVFPIMGVERSHHDFYQGMGYSLSLFLALCAFLLHQIVPLMAREPAASKSLLGGMSLAFAAMTVLSIRWFFPAPIILSAVTALSLAYAALRLPSKSGSGQRPAQFS